MLKYIRNTKGLTYIEIILVIIIGVIISAGSMISVGNFRMDEETYLTRVVSDIEKVQSYSITSTIGSTRPSMSFSANQYSRSSIGNEVGTQTINFPKSVSISKVTGANPIYFDPQGRPRDSATGGNVVDFSFVIGSSKTSYLVKVLSTGAVSFTKQ